MNIQQKIDELQKQIDLLKNKQNRKIYFLNRYFTFQDYANKTNSSFYVFNPPCVKGQTKVELTLSICEASPLEVQFTYMINDICILNLFNYTSIDKLEIDTKKELNILINRYSTFIEIEKKYMCVGHEPGWLVW